jgi:LysM domain/Putative amidoligase enzyme
MDEEEDEIGQEGDPEPAPAPVPIDPLPHAIIPNHPYNPFNNEVREAFNAVLIARQARVREPHVGPNPNHWEVFEEVEGQINDEQEDEVIPNPPALPNNMRIRWEDVARFRPGGGIDRGVNPFDAWGQPPPIPRAAPVPGERIADVFQRAREQLNVPNPFNEEPRAAGNDMNYDQLVRRYPQLADRYIPDLSNRSNAARALQQFDQDQAGTADERAALSLYLNGHVQASNINYRWCAECDMMVGLENHNHCPFCTYAMIARQGDEERANHHEAACGNCSECCRQKGHRHCPSCDAHMERSCRHCAKCSNCCACVLCTQAGCQFMQECEDCKKCYDHCICEAVKTSDASGKTFPSFKASERKLFDSTRLSGIEWEYNRASDQRAMDYWTRKWRGNLHRDDSCGYEAVTPPVAGDYMVRCVTSMGKVLARASIDNRCSIHTHVDAKDMQWTDMFRFLDLYARIEPILYMIAGQERLDNRYAVPIGKEYATALKRVDRKDAIMAVAFCPLERDGRKHAVTTMPDHGRNSQREKPGRRADNHQYCRRKGLNILPWLAGRGPRPQTPIHVPVKAGDTLEKLALRHGVSIAALMRWNKIKPDNTKLGKQVVINKRTLAPDTTVEFRIHPNTNDPIRVINWVKVVTRLVEWSVKHTDKDLENLPKSALRILCQHVVPECAPWIMTRVKEWRKETARNSGRQSRRITLKGGRYEY